MEGKKWPPDQGPQFFLAWLGATIVYGIVQQLTHVAHTLRIAPRAMPMLTLILPLLVWSAFQAWLLFPANRLRLGLWTALAACAPLFSPRTLSTAAYVALGITIFQSALLFNIRRHPWALLLAKMAGLGLWTVSAPLLVETFGSLFTELNAEYGPFPILISKTLHGSVQFGVWLLVGETLIGAVLAWCMPPVKLEGKRGQPQDPIEQ